jgi:hypothetical protein
MITLPGLAAGALGSFLANDMRDRFGVSHARLAEIVPATATPSTTTSSTPCSSPWPRSPSR